MRIVVVGVGAMGSIYAALLADSGHKVWVMDPWEAHTSAISRDGLRVEGASGNRCVKSIQVARSSNDLPQAELFIIATKASQVANAAKAILPALGNHSKVLTIQNGLGSGQRIAKYLNPDKVFIGVAEGFGAAVKAPGHVQHTAMKMIRIGAYTQRNAAEIEPLANLWREAGFNAQAYSDIEQLIWEKFICNVAYSAPCTVFNKSVKALLQDKHARKISQACATEAWRVAKAKNVNLSFDDPIEYVTAFGNKVGDAKPSMLLDHLAQRASEIDAINGMVPVVAEEEKLQAPCNEVLSAIVLSRESEW